MLHTRDGSRVAMYCFWYGNAKVGSLSVFYFLPEFEIVHKKNR